MNELGWIEPSYKCEQMLIYPYIYISMWYFILAQPEMTEIWTYLGNKGAKVSLEVLISPGKIKFYQLCNWLIGPDISSS